MTAEETNKKEDKAKSDKPEDGPTGSGAFDSMKACCTAEVTFSDCASMMKKIMGAMPDMPCCGPGMKKTESEGRKR